ncbi:MAG: hypothetical protein OHK006_21990 [Thermodesulfovibrionales bacterium]
MTRYLAIALLLLLLAAGLYTVYTRPAAQQAVKQEKAPAEVKQPEQQVSEPIAAAGPKSLPKPRAIGKPSSQAVPVQARIEPAAPAAIRETQAPGTAPKPLETQPAFSPAAPAPSLADAFRKTQPPSPATAPKATCADLAAAIKNGTAPHIALRDALRRSPDNCDLIRCALENGMSLKTVFAAAQDAGIRSSFVAQCSNSACAQAYSLLETDDLCRLIKSEIDRGKKPEEAVLEQLRRGQQACTAIKCGLVAGGELEAIVRAAQEARVAPDIISRCCLDACADPGRVARALQQTGFAGQAEDEFIPIESSRPGGTRRTYLSPSGF